MSVWTCDCSNCTCSQSWLSIHYQYWHVQIREIPHRRSYTGVRWQGTQAGCINGSARNGPVSHIRGGVGLAVTGNPVWRMHIMSWAWLSICLLLTPFLTGNVISCLVSVEVALRCHVPKGPWWDFFPSCNPKSEHGDFSLANTRWEETQLHFCLKQSLLLQF